MFRCECGRDTKDRLRSFKNGAVCQAAAADHKQAAEALTNRARIALCLAAIASTDTLESDRRKLIKRQRINALSLVRRTL